MQSYTPEPALVRGPKKNPSVQRCPLQMEAPVPSRGRGVSSSDGHPRGARSPSENAGAPPQPRTLSFCFPWLAGVPEVPLEPGRFVGSRDSTDADWWNLCGSASVWSLFTFQ